MLFIIATPIGNLKDITLRALEILKSVDVIFCEDTRETRKLLNHYQIEKRLFGLHQHSSEEKIKSLLKQFNDIAYVTDAGTPGVSDPGNKIVRAAVELNILVSPIPGPCALSAALSVAGFATDKFCFLGFLPHKSKNKIYEQIRDSKITICFYESPHRIERTLNDLKERLNAERQIVVCRELTKKFETIYRGDISAVGEAMKKKIKGEFVVIVAKK
ncbi:16S rRNA (cytidine(1402)-2'-O)-methyltransferase [Candidatus Falkowbacteria bacterium]|nr:16S rRNA (cytidine(1402)-2'-O)-methyltransferase [Candidatus Falkowbacteria bacterium]